MSCHIVGYLSLLGYAGRLDAAQIVKSHWSEIEQERGVDLLAVAVVGRELQLGVAAVDGAGIDTDRQSEHVDTAAVSGRNVRGDVDAREFLRVIRDRIHVGCSDTHVFLAELLAEID